LFSQGELQGQYQYANANGSGSGINGITGLADQLNQARL
jgi:hypothetical protein